METDDASTRVFRAVVVVLPQQCRPTPTTWAAGAMHLKYVLLGHRGASVSGAVERHQLNGHDLSEFN